MDDGELQARQLISFANQSREGDNWPDVLLYAQEAAAIPAAPPDVTGVAHYLCEMANRRLGQTGAALRSCDAGLSVGGLPPRLRSLLLRLRADHYREQGNLAKALNDLAAALECPGIDEEIRSTCQELQARIRGML